MSSRHYYYLLFNTYTQNGNDGDPPCAPSKRGFGKIPNEQEGYPLPIALCEENSAADKTDCDFCSHPLNMSQLYHEHRQRFKITRACQRSCIYRFEADFSD